MARTESSEPRLDVKSGRPGVPPRHATGAGTARGRGDPRRGDGSPALERIVAIASRAGSAAALAAMNEIAPHAQRFNRVNPSIAARPHDGGGRRPGEPLEALRLEIGAEWGDEEFELDVDSAREDPLARLIETERGRMMLIDSLLGALHALFEEQHETHREPFGLSRADPSLIVVLLRKMLGGIINRLDRNYVDPLIKARSQGRETRRSPQRKPTGASRRSSTAGHGKGRRPSRQSASSTGVGRRENVRRATL